MNDWHKIVTRGFESKELDYKGPMAWNTDDKASCCKLVKDILALANTQGGWLVIGVTEGNKGVFVTEGLSESQTASFETTRINQFIQNYSDPPINTTVVRVPIDGKLFIILQVPAFADTPHICQKDFPGVLSAATVYVRTDNNESAPIKASSDFRALIEHALRKRSNSLLSSVRSILTEGAALPIPSDLEQYEKQVTEAMNRCSLLDTIKVSLTAPYRETVFFPTRFSKHRFSLDKLRKLIQQASVDYRGLPFIFWDRRGESTYATDDAIETAMNGKQDLHFWQLRQSGLLYTREVLEMWSENERILDFDSFALLACDAVQTLVNLYSEDIHDEDEITMRFNIIGTQGLPFASSNLARFIARNRERWTYCRAESVNYEVTHRMAEWRAGVEVHALDICEHVFQRFNVRESTWPTEAKKLMEKMLSRSL